MPLLPLTGVTVVAVNLSPSLLLVLHTRDPLASSIVVPGPMFPVFATGAGGGGGGAGAGAGVGVAAGGVAAGGVVAGAVLGCDGAGAGAATTGPVRVPPRGAASLRTGERGSGARRPAPLCCDPELGALAGATAADAGGVSDL
jgi:hypothetical protein